MAASIAQNNVRLVGLQSEIDRIGREIVALGAVNLAALDELGVARERKEFLDAQSADLVDALNTLEDAIRKIDAETRELLSGTFNAVNEHFGRMFPELFGGGNARLVMTGDGLHVVVDDAAHRIPEFEILLRRAEIHFDPIQQVAPTIEDLFVDAVGTGAPPLRWMMGFAHKARSPLGGPKARTVSMNLTF